MRRFIPVRNPVAPGTDDPVKCLAGGRQFCPRLGGNNDVDKRIDSRIGDAGKILRTLCRCGLR